MIYANYSAFFFIDLDFLLHCYHTDVFFGGAQKARKNRTFASGRKKMKKVFNIVRRGVETAIRKGFPRCQKSY